MGDPHRDDPHDPSAAPDVPAALLEEPGPPDVRLSVGLELWLDLVRGDRPLRLPSSCRGWVPREFLLVDAPARDGEPIRTSKGEVLTARYVLGGVLYAFECGFLRKLVEPRGLWCLSWPRTAQCRTLRRHPRIPTSIPVTLSGWNEPALIVDLGAGGALLQLSEGARLASGSDVVIGFHLPNGTEVTGLDAEVRNVDEEAPELVGVAFRAPESPGVQAIRTFLESCLDRVTR